MKKFPSKFLAYWGILAVRIENRKECPKRAFTHKDWHKMLPPYFEGTLQQGKPPLRPSVYNMEVVEVPSIRVLLKFKLD